MAKTPDPIQALLATARRTQILDAAITVFSEKGFHRATIKEMAPSIAPVENSRRERFSYKNQAPEK
jgi:hypothetical protein